MYVLRTNASAGSQVRLRLHGNMAILPRTVARHLHPVTKAKSCPCMDDELWRKLQAQWRSVMARSLVLVPLILLLTGCGVAETGAAAAAAGAAKAQEAREGLKTEARVREQLDAASKQAADQRNAAEAQSQ
jgi:hypothetical protein